MKGLSVTRFGYGYAQGVDAAAVEMDVHPNIKFVYGGQYFGDNDITKYVDNWYKNNTEIVFACGGSIYTSAALAAKDNGGKIVGVDSDQSIVVDRDYGKGICVTSAMKGITATVKMVLQRLYNLEDLGDHFYKLGLISSTNLDSNFVGLPIKTWSMKKFSVDDYKVLLDDIIKGRRVVSSDIETAPTLINTTLVEYGSIK